MPTHWMFRNRRPARRRHQGKTRLLLEVLEDRTVFSVDLQSLYGPVSWDFAGTTAAQTFTQTEVVAAIRAADPVGALASFLADEPEHVLADMIDLLASQQLLTEADDTRVTELALNDTVDPLEVVRQLEALPFVVWASPNFVYQPEVSGDPRDFIPNDPQYASQYHHPLMRNHLAWDTTLGIPSIIIAVTDDGVSLAHVDLAANIWVNPGEIPGNGVDDEGNGFIDDVNGWDFSSNDNDPNPVGGQAHGTHVSGIAAARIDNALGVAGTAGRSTIMPIRFFGSSPWTSTVILNSYSYAVDNGAKIISTSYNVDGFVSDPIFRSALDYLYSHGGMHFNSAGNNSQLNPPRQVFDHSLYVVSTDSADRKSSFSNYGFGVDISAPGSSILSTLPGNAYGFNSGTSMATPNAAGVAALIWSANPTWTREQVAAKLIGTADNIDALNPTQCPAAGGSCAGLLGSGRANSFRGVTETLRAPRIKSVQVLPPEGGTTSSPITAFSVDLANILNPATVTIGNFELRGDGPDNTFGTPDDVLLPLSQPAGFTYRLGTNRLSFTVGAAMTHDRYRFRAISGGLRDPFGTALDGNGDMVPGDHFDRTFFFVPAPVIVDNGQPGYADAPVGTWFDWTGGFNGSFRYADPGTGGTASWTVTGLTPGPYTVQATWTSDPSHAPDVPYRIYDGGTLLQTQIISQRLEPSGPSFGGRPFQGLGAVTITGTSLRVEMDSSGGGYAIADAIRVAAAPPPVVDLNWSGGGITGPTSTNTEATFTISRTYNIAGASAPSDFTIGYYSSVDATFGNADDVLLGNQTITAAADKTVGTHAGTSPALQITAPGTYHLFARVDNGNAIPETNETNNVAQAPAQIVVTLAPTGVIVDNGQPGYTELGTWQDWTGGFGGNFRYADPGLGGTARWSVTGLTAGSYTVQGTWMSDPSHAPNATYRIYDGGTLLQTVTIDQRVEPTGGPTIGGRPFQTLGTVLLSGSNLRVEMDQSADGYAIADAVRIVPV